MPSEKDMEDAICRNPERYPGEEGLKFIARQYRIDGYIFDLLFEDRHGAKLILEIQKGTLDRNHLYKILDYYDEFKENNPDSFIELMIIANKITYERRKKLDSKGISWKEIFESEFQEPIGNGKDISPPPPPPPRPPNSTGIIELRQKFFEGLLQKTKIKTNLFDKVTSKTKKPWMAAGIGMGIGLQYYIYGNKGGVKLSIYFGQIKNKTIFVALYTQKDDIGREIGFSLDWEPNDDKRESLIRKWFNNGGLDYPEYWPELQDKMVDAMVKFGKAFLPRLKELGIERKNEICWY